MIKSILKYFDSPAEQLPLEDSEKRLQVAACALMVEMAKSDEDFSEEERQTIIHTMTRQFGLQSPEVEEIIQLAEEELDESIQLWRFTNRINKGFSNEEKIRLIELIWKVIFADGRLDAHEDHLVHRMATLLNLTHRQLIDAKVKVRKEIQ